MSPAWLDALLSVAHFVCVFLLVGALTAEIFLLRLKPSAEWLRVLGRVDAFYGLAAILLIAAGLARVFLGLRDESYYWASHAFWGKMAVFAVIGLISIRPTIAFIRWRAALKADAAFLPAEKAVASMRRLAMIEAHLLVLVILFAAMMARGLG